MVDPILRIRLTFQCGALNVNVLVRSIKIDVPDGCSLARELVGDADLLEEGRRDNFAVLACAIYASQTLLEQLTIHVLAWVGEDAHHRERDK